MRIAEARSLLGARHFSGAYYLAGYAVECALKSCIARETRRFDFPDVKRVQKSYEHNPAKLLSVANLDAALALEEAQNANFAANWAIVKTWSEASRYAVWDRADAETMITAVARPRDGVLPWLRRHW